MKTYELMFIVPGTLTEEEVVPQVATIESLVQAIDAVDVQTKSLGKAKLAYPMNHIRYGYFYTIIFTAEPANIPDLQRQLNLQKGYLRTIINIAIDSAQTRDNAPDALITIEKKQDLIDERKKAFARFKEEATPAQTVAPKKVVTPEPAPESTVAPKKAAVEKETLNMEDIDKKLDDIIAGDDITENV